MPRETTYRLVVINPDGTRTVLGTHLTEAQAKAIVIMLSQGTIRTQILIEPDPSA